MDDIAERAAAKSLKIPHSNFGVRQHLLQTSNGCFNCFQLADKILEQYVIAFSHFLICKFQTNRYQGLDMLMEYKVA